MDIKPIKTIGSDHIQHNNDVEHGLGHLERHWNSQEVKDAFHLARSRGSAEFRNEHGQLYVLTHKGGNDFKLDWKR